MRKEEVFQYGVAEACKEIVALPADTEEVMEAKLKRGFVIDGGDIDYTVASIKTSLQTRMAANRRRFKHGLGPGEIIAGKRREVLGDFRILLQLAAVDSPILQTLGIEERPLRGALYCGAQQVITETKLGLAEEALGVDIFGANLDILDMKEGPDRIQVLERLQEKLVAKR